MRIEICGGIASGKTTLARLINSLGIESVLEDFSQNPFWVPFYTNPGKYVLETEITFLMQHYHEIKKKNEKHSDFVCDFSLLVDLAYAKIGLEGKKFNVFKSVFSEIVSEIHFPQLIIHLSCDPLVQFARIKQRSRSEEKLITVDFLNKLNIAINKEVEEVNDSINVISIDSAKQNFVNDDNTRKSLIDDIRNIIS
jgi:deoxyguanosine kinase